MIERIIRREAIRAILLTAEREVLLLRIHPPGKDHWFWITPGGGLESGETTEEGLKRELREELGIDKFSLGPLVWRRQHTFDWGGRRICQRERYYVVHIDRFEPHMSDANEAELLDRFHWWTISELASCSECITPLSLVQIVRRYLRDGPPQEPLELEILVD